MRAVLSGVLALVVAAGLTAPARADGGDPEPGDPAYAARDARNVAAAYGRITGPGGQLENPAYLPALVEQTTRHHVDQLLTQAAAPDRLALTPGLLVPGWDVGNPLRAGWDGTRGRSRPVAFEARNGALLRGTVYRPLRRARDPYTGERLRPPYPGVVVTEGSVQGSEGMYAWLAQDLAERGYVVLTYDVQGQGASETFPHDGTCCSGVPAQQLGNFVTGTEDALDFFTSRANPYRRWYDDSPDRRSATPGRTGRIAIVGHSMGAAAVSRVQGTDRRVATVVALDKLTGPSSAGPLDGDDVVPTVPALAVQSEYGFTVAPWFLAGGSSLNPEPSPDGPDPRRERATGYDAWRAAGVDAMLVVPRASTHLEYTDIPLVLPASRWGQALTSAYVQRWLGHYLRHDRGIGSLLAPSLRYLEPVGAGRWRPVRLARDRHLSFYACSAYGLTGARGVRQDGDWTGVGC